MLCEGYNRLYYLSCIDALKRSNVLIRLRSSLFHGAKKESNLNRFSAETNHITNKMFKWTTFYGSYHILRIQMCSTSSYRGRLNPVIQNHSFLFFHILFYGVCPCVSRPGRSLRPCHGSSSRCARPQGFFYLKHLHCTAITVRLHSTLASAALTSTALHQRRTSGAC